MILRVHQEEQGEVFRGFGASGAWWAQIVGGWKQTDEESGLSVRDRISQLLWSRSEGIGMSIYRYNLGAGSKYQGGGVYDQPARRAESFDIGGRYDMSRDENAVYMMRRAVQDGAEDVIFFVNSPPVSLTKNGLAHQTPGKYFRENISRQNYPAFAKYCLDVTEYFVKQGVPVRYLSPINEPIWVWNGGQEGCFYRPASVRRVFAEFCRQLEGREALRELRLAGTESGDLRFFNKSYTRALLDDPKIRSHMDAVDVHSYCQPAPFAFLNDRQAFQRRFRKWMDKNYPDMPVSVSEWTHMQGGRDAGMDSALVTANTILDDLILLRAVSWQHWIAVSEVDFCDGLIYIDLNRKTFSTTKRLYVTGNFSRYIRPGAVRIGVSGCEEGCKAVSYWCENRRVTVVANFTEQEKQVSFPDAAGQVLHVLTDETHSLSEQTAENGENLIMPPRSVNTFLF